ncbi:hypothetical protein E2P47_04785 [Candidatus Bathyarchaeota archaeon]|nr:hypothetical protein E2P47_04785 [Candidatus Bathyarchaeota archaeon]
MRKNPLVKNSLVGHTFNHFAANKALFWYWGVFWFSFQETYCVFAAWNSFLVLFNFYRFWFCLFFFRIFLFFYFILFLNIDNHYF